MLLSFSLNDKDSSIYWIQSKNISHLNTEQVHFFNRWGSWATFKFLPFVHKFLNCLKQEPDLDIAISWYISSPFNLSVLYQFLCCSRSSSDLHSSQDAEYRPCCPWGCSWSPVILCWIMRLELYQTQVQPGGKKILCHCRCWPVLNLHSSIHGREYSCRALPIGWVRSYAEPLTSMRKASTWIFLWWPLLWTS